MEQPDRSIEAHEKALWILKERRLPPDPGALDLIGLELEHLAEGGYEQAAIALGRLAGAFADTCDTLIDELVEVKGRAGEETTFQEVHDWLYCILEAVKRDHEEDDGPDL